MEPIPSISHQTATARALDDKPEEDHKDGVKACDIRSSDEGTALDDCVDGNQVLDEATPKNKPTPPRLGDAVQSKVGDDVKLSMNDNPQAHLLDDLEKIMLPFMPPITTSRQGSVMIAEDGSIEAFQDQPISGPAQRSDPNILSISPKKEEEGPRGPSDANDPATTSSKQFHEDGEQEDENPPPLLPRRKVSPLLVPAKPELNHMASWNDIFAPLGATTSLSLSGPSSEGVSSQPRETNVILSSQVQDRGPSALSRPGTGLGDNAPTILAVGTHPGKIWESVLLDEEVYIEQMNKFTNIFYGVVIKEWPFLEKHMEAIVVARQLAPLHQRYIVNTVKEQTAQNAFVVCDPRLFTNWASETHRVLKEYSRRYPQALYALRLTRSRDKRFDPCIETIGLGLTAVGQSWEDHLALPIAQLKTYIIKLQAIGEWLEDSSMPVPTKEQSRVKAILETLQRLCQNALN